MTMPAPTRLVARHSLRGRTRLDAPLLYRAFSRAAEVEAALSQLDGVLEASVNPRLGSVLLRFRETLSPEVVQARAALEIARVFSAPPSDEPRRYAAKPSTEPRADLAPRPMRRGSDTRRAWHALRAREVCDLLRCKPEFGLAESDAKHRLLRYGPNRIPAPGRRSGVSIFVDQFKSLPVGLLAGSAVVSVATGGFLDAGAIVVVVVANAVIGYVTESNAERTIRSLERSQPKPVKVRRNGSLLEIDPELLVPGDIVLLSRARVVPADARLLSARTLTLDESPLTGESLPVEKRAEHIAALKAPIADRKNMVFRGTVVTGGEGEGLVVATGSATELGRIQSLVQAVQRRPTPLQLQLDQLSQRLALGAVLVCGGVFLLGLVRGQSLIRMLKTSVSLAVAAVPEGLPTVAVTTLALGIQRMEQHNVSVRHLSAVETLGAIESVCLDKTGTITENRMLVQALTVDGRPYSVGSQTHERRIEVDKLAEPSLTWLLRVGLLCSEVVFERTERGSRFTGSPTEKALVDFAQENGLDVRAERRRFPLLRIEHRSEEAQLMTTLHQRRDTDDCLRAVKGRPSDVLRRCRYQLRQGRIEPLTSEGRAAIEAENEQLAARALRVLGFAFMEHVAEHEPEAEGLVWIGLLGLADPVRPETAELLRRFHRAGIATLMITGDQSSTARAVAGEIGLAPDQPLTTLDSVELAQLEPDVLQKRVLQAEVFARVSPAHKLRIVQALQAAGRVVAMTGDGINDGPALKAADVGIAMGEGGAAVARDVADVVLNDDRLEKVILAVEQGRTIYDDIKKAVQFILATNLSEILLTLAQVAMNRGQTLSPMQLLWINMLTDVAPELALAAQPAESDVMQRPPRPSKQAMFTSRDLRRIGRQGALLTGSALLAQGWTLRRTGHGTAANTVGFMTLTSGQLLHAISARSESHSIFGRARLEPNPYIALSVGGSLALQILAGLWSPLRRVLGTQRLVASDWLVSSAFAAAPFVINELWKLSPSRSSNRAPSPEFAPEDPEAAVSANKPLRSSQRD